MIRYITVKNNEILQISEKQPSSIPEGVQLLTYEGIEPDEILQYVDGKIIATVEPPIPVFVKKYQKEKIKEIEQKINDIRSQYMNETSFQTEVYLEKTQQAIDYLINPQQDISNFPLLNIEVEITGKSGIEIAEKIINKRKQWLSFLTKTEKIRLLTKQQINKCKTKEDIDMIFNQFIVSINNIK